MTKIAFINVKKTISNKGFLQFIYTTKSIMISTKTLRSTTVFYVNDTDIKKCFLRTKSVFLKNNVTLKTEVKAA